MKLVVALLMVLITKLGSIGQEVPQAETDVKGPVKSIAVERVYVRKNGRNIGEERVPLSLIGYDGAGRVVEDITYGLGILRKRYRYMGTDQIAKIEYLDSSGHQLEDPTKFKPNGERVDETGLCAAYAIRQEIDDRAKIVRTYETCPDGTSRATVVDELTENGDLIRSIRLDARARSWESTCDYDKAGNLSEFRYKVSVGSKPFTYTMIYSDHKFDKYGNWVRLTATAFNSKWPGELLFQYNEIQIITYYDDAAAPKQPH
jgi:hypothetical protein